MKKLLYLVSILLIFSCCGQRQQKVEKIMEDGVEVIVNHFEPYQIKGELKNEYGGIWELDVSWEGFESS